MIRMSTRHTLESALCLTVGFIHMPARVTRLACVAWIDTCHRLKFIVAILVEPTVRSVEHGSVQTCLRVDVLARVLCRAFRGCRHVLQLQVLADERLRTVGKEPAVLVGLILATILLFTLPLGDLPLGYSSAI